MLVFHEQFLIDDKGKKTAVVIPMKEYEAMLEDLHDLKAAAMRKKDKTVTISDMKTRMKKHGKI